MIDGSAVVHELDLPAPPERVFAMFTDAGQLVRWIGIAVDLTPEPGGQFRFEVAPGQFCEGEYVVVEPHSRIVLTWGWTDPAFGLPPGSSRVEVTFTASGAGTRLRLVHDQLPGDLRLLHDDGWTRFLARLDAELDGRDPGPYPDESPEERVRLLQPARPGPGPPDRRPTDETRDGDRGPRPATG